MKRTLILLSLLVIFLAVPSAVFALEPEPPVTVTLIGQVQSGHEEPIAEASVSLWLNGQPIAAEGAETHTLADGSYRLVVDLAGEEVSLVGERGSQIALRVEKVHYRSSVVPIADDGWIRGDDRWFANVPPMALPRQSSIGLYLGGLIFVGILAALVTERLHKTTAALLGTSLILGISYLGGYFNLDLQLLTFEQAVEYIDFNVIFLIMGMMIYVAMAEETGIFQRIAYLAYRVSGGRPVRLSFLLMIITAITSALLDNVTTMLLMTPITVEIALVMGLNPLPLLMSMVLASNVGGASTLVGDPPNILIGSYANLSFLDFIVNMGPPVFAAFIALMGVTYLQNRKSYAEASQSHSVALLERLEADARIRDMKRLRRVAIVGGAMLVLFLSGEFFHMEPGVVAILGATALLTWERPNVKEMLDEVDWTTLVFFMGLFIMVGALEEVGVIQIVADLAGRLAAGNLTVALLLILWVSAIFSGIVDNIPFTAAMLPVVAFLSRTVPGGESMALYWALALGACFGGNATLIGASANMVAAGIAERAGYPITYGRFLRYGIPATLVTVTVATLWLLIRY